MDNETANRAVPLRERGTVRHAAQVYGHSAQGLPLDGYGPCSGPVDVLVMAAMHGDESDTTVVLSEALRAVRPEDLVNPAILSVNPDGALRGTRGSARGVDLNRNWPTSNWSSQPLLYRGHGRERQEIELGTGSSQGSEPETQHLLGLVRTLQPRTIISLHAPLGCVEDPGGGTLAAWIADAVNLPAVRDVGYETPGSFGTWSLEQGIEIITWELPAEPLPAIMASHAPVLFRILRGDYPPGTR